MLEAAGDATVCCGWGTHGVDAATGNSFVLGSYLADAPAIVTDRDIQPLTQQLAEFINDPLHDPQGLVVGLAGISRDLRADESSHPAYSKLAAAVQYIQDNYVQPLNLKQLAEMADMSVAQLERYFHKVFHLTPRQVLLKTRLDAATALLVTTDRVTDVAALCGYTDHSAFTRQFKATVGITPTEYRMLLHGSARS